MSNTVITNYTDLNGPSTKADSSVVVIVNKDGSLSVDHNLLGTLMGTDGTQSAGISVVRVGHEGKPDDATDSESEDDKIPHVTLTVDSYYDEPNSIIKYDSGAEMLQSLRIETRENSLIGFQNDHCYTSLTSPSQAVPQNSETFTPYDDPVIEISHAPPPKPVPSSKKITILEQQIIPKGKKIQINPTESPIIFKGSDVLNKPLPVLTKTKEKKEVNKVENLQQNDESDDSSSETLSSGESLPDRDSDSDYKDRKETSSGKHKKSKAKPRILKATPSKPAKPEKAPPKTKTPKIPVKKEIKEVKIIAKPVAQIEEKDSDVDLESLLPVNKINTSHTSKIEFNKTVVKQSPKPVKKEKKTPAHVTALLSDMTSLFSTPDVIRRVSTDGKTPGKPEPGDKKSPGPKPLEICEGKIVESPKVVDSVEKSKPVPKSVLISKKDTKLLNPTDKTKSYDLIPQLDDVSLAQILQDTTGISHPAKNPSITTTAAMNSPGLAGPLSPTLDLLGGLQPEEEGLTEDLLMHVAQLVESSENLQEVIDKQVLGKVDTVAVKTPVQIPYQPVQNANPYTQSLTKSAQKTIAPRKEPIEIVRRDGRVITLPPIEAPATRSSKRKSQIETSVNPQELPLPIPSTLARPVSTTPEPVLMQQTTSKQYINKKLVSKKQEQPVDKMSAESQESWNSEDDPYRLWCICKQPHNNRFMICCDGCEDWFHGKCVNITKAMGQQMEEQGIEWRCPNCVKKTKGTPKPAFKTLIAQKRNEPAELPPDVPKSPVVKESPSKTSCIVCKKAARASSIYCSNACILKHAQDSLGQNAKQDAESEKSQDRKSSISQDSTVIVYERKSGRLLAGPNAPTAGNLKAWLQKNPTFEVVRPGTLSTIKPGLAKRKSSTPAQEVNKVQTTLNFERIPRKSAEHLISPRGQTQEERKRVLPSPKQEIRAPLTKTPIPKTPITKAHMIQMIETPKASTSSARPIPEPRKIVRQPPNRQQSTDKPSASPSTPRRKDSGAGQSDKNKMNSDESIRDNVRKSLQEQLSLRMAETEGVKFTENEIQEFANETELELHDLFKDVGMKYKAKYRSLMFNIKDRKNLTLWEKICDKSITPKQLVRLSPEELASQELAEWRDQETKHQLELIKKSELDLLAASKTYVLKTHKGEQVMEAKEAVSTELDSNVPVEDVVVALNDSIGGEENPKEVGEDGKSKPDDKKESSKKRGRDNANSSRSKKSKRDSKRDSNRKHSRRKSPSRESSAKDEQRRSTRRHSEKKSRTRSASRDRSKRDSKEKSGSVERSRHRSRSKDKSNKWSRSRSASKERTRDRSRHRTRSRDESRHPHRSRSKHPSPDEHKHRSKSQDSAYTKNKTDSTDSDSIERPKSATLKDQHPEYDPHEPMITSAFSEEDLRKSEDAYDDNYKSEVIDTVAEYDPTKSFTLDTNVILPSEPFPAKNDKMSEAESDQEPSSTVDNAAATIWNGCINMVDVARFYVAAHEVSGSAVDLEEDLSTELDIVGRINPDTVWDYIAKTKKTSNKDIVILKLQAANDEEKMQYIALYSYLSSRSRLGVVKVPNTTSIKDFYIVPLPANTALQPVLLPLDGPGLGDVKTHLLIAIIIRQRRKRLAPAPLIPKDVVPSKVAKVSRKRSYTPPVVSKSSYTPPTSPQRERGRRTLPLPSYPGSALSTSVKDKIAASLACADDEEAYSPGSSNSSSGGGGGAPATAPAPAPAPAVILPPAGTGTSLRTKMEELNRQIEEQKQQILKMAQADSSVNPEDEAYSPSRPMTPPPVVPPALADISLPSNLQEILANIKKRSEKSTTDVDMRTMPPLP